MCKYAYDIVKIRSSIRRFVTTSSEISFFKYYRFFIDFIFVFHFLSKIVFCQNIPASFLKKASNVHYRVD